MSTFKSVTCDAAKIAAIQEEPALVWRALEPSNADPYIDAAAAARLRARIIGIVGPEKAAGHDPFVEMLKASKAWRVVRRVMIRKEDQAVDKLPSFEFVSAERTELTLDGNWEALEAALGKLVPGPNLFTGGTPLHGVAPRASTGLPPACFVPEVVAEISSAYGAVPEDAVRHALGNGSGDVLESLLEDFHSLRALLENAASLKLGLVTVRT